MMVMKERGNILFLILLAIILFVALSYAVTGQREQVKTGGEQVDALAAQIVQAGNLLENTIMREMVVNSVPEYGFDFSGTNSNSTANATCTSQNCRLITGSGGKVSLPAIPVWASNNYSASFANANVWVIEVMDVGTSAPDVVLFYRYLSDDLCAALNKGLGQTGINLSVSDGIGNSAVNNTYSGTMTAIVPPTSTTSVTYGDDDPTLRGRRAFCHRNNAGLVQNVYVQVLIAR